MTTPDEGLAAALYQLSEHAERIGGLDTREAQHFQEIGGRLSDLGTRVKGLGGTLADQAEILAGLEGLDEAVATLTARLDEVLPAEDGDAPVYRPVPAPRWWVLDGADREQAVARLRAWVHKVYLPSYGHISASLGRCWERHPLCLFTLDWLSELWSVLYLQSARTGGGLSSQAEWQTRLLAAAAEQMAIETSRCEHDQARDGRSTGSALRSAS
jgi:hypothetical protein